MADQTGSAPDQPAKKKNILIIYPLFFIVSFIIVFSILYILSIGFENPIARLNSSGDSTAVAVDTTALAQQAAESEPNEIAKADTSSIAQKPEPPNKEDKPDTTRDSKKAETVNDKAKTDTLKAAKEEETQTVKGPVPDTSASKSAAEVEKPAPVVRAAPKNADSDSLKKVLAELNREKSERKKQADEISKLQKQLNNKEKSAERAGNLKRLAKVYESMRAENAAQIMRELDNKLISELFGVIKQRQAGKIMAALPPDRAAQITRLLGKN